MKGQKCTQMYSLAPISRLCKISNDASYLLIGLNGDKCTQYERSCSLSLSLSLYIYIYIYIDEVLNSPALPPTVVLAPLTLIFKHTTRTDVAPLVSGVTGHAQLPDVSHYRWIQLKMPFRYLALRTLFCCSLTLSPVLPETSNDDHPAG